MADKKRRDACLRSTFLQDAIKALEGYEVRLFHSGRVQDDNRLYDLDRAWQFLENISCLDESALEGLLPD